MNANTNIASACDDRSQHSDQCEACYFSRGQARISNYHHSDDVELRLVVF